MISPCGPRLTAIFLTLLCAAIPSIGRAQARSDIPRGPDGKPDLSGIWQVLNSAAWDLQDHSGALGLPPGQGVVEGGTIPYQPAAAAKQRDNFEHRDTDDPAEATCYLPGVPRATYMPFPFEIIQTPKLGRLLVRVRARGATSSPTDHRTHTVFPISGWATRAGVGRATRWWSTSPTSTTAPGSITRGTFTATPCTSWNAIRRSTPAHIMYEATLEDPKVFSRPWKISMPLYRRIEKNVKLLEYECVYYLQDKRYGNAKPVGVAAMRTAAVRNIRRRGPPRAGDDTRSGERSGQSGAEVRRATHGRWSS